MFPLSSWCIFFPLSLKIGEDTYLYLPDSIYLTLFIWLYLRDSIYLTLFTWLYQLTEQNKANCPYLSLQLPPTSSFMSLFLHLEKWYLTLWHKIEFYRFMRNIVSINRWKKEILKLKVPMCIVFYGVFTTGHTCTYICLLHDTSPFFFIKKKNNILFVCWCVSKFFLSSDSFLVLTSKTLSNLMKLHCMQWCCKS